MSRLEFVFKNKQVYSVIIEKAKALLFRLQVVYLPKQYN